MRPYFLLCLMALCILATQSCKQGCTNPSAFNYDPEAKSDDASCMYCDTAWQPFSTAFDVVSDNDPDSPFPFQSVLTVNTMSSLQVFSGNACNKYGFVTNQECSTFAHQLQLTNLTNRTITLSGTVFITYNTFNGSVSTSAEITNIQIPPNQVTTTDQLGRICVSNPGSFNASIFNQTITYN